MAPCLKKKLTTKQGRSTNKGEIENNISSECQEQRQTVHREGRLELGLVQQQACGGGERKSHPRKGRHMLQILMGAVEADYYADDVESCNHNPTPYLQSIH